MNSALRADVVDGQQIGMAQRAQGARFLFEPLQAVGITRERFREHLDGNAAVQARITSPIDLAHAARTQGRLDFVWAKPCAGGKRHAWRRLYLRLVCPSESGA